MVQSIYLMFSEEDRRPLQNCLQDALSLYS
jgi:hypothetical protein